MPHLWTFFKTTRVSGLGVKVGLVAVKVFRILMCCGAWVIMLDLAETTGLGIMEYGNHGSGGLDHWGFGVVRWGWC